MVYTVPHDNIFPARGRRSSDGEQQAAVEGNLQVSQHLPSQGTVRQVTGTRETDGKEGTARMRMFGSLDGTGNAANDKYGRNVKLKTIDNIFWEVLQQ